MKKGSNFSFYKLIEQIGQGGFGSVWMVKSSEDNNYYAIKIEPADSKRRQLEFESSVLKHLHGSDRFPKYILDGVEDGHFFLVEELLGPNLSTIADNMPSKHFSNEYIYKLADELLSCIEHFHSKGYIHRDIKPQNFAVRVFGKENESPICLLDYGISRRFVDKEGKHLEARQHVSVAGSPSFASPNNHLKIELSRRDDLYSWLYTVVSLSEVPLPWSPNEGIESIGEKKKSNPISSLVAPLGEEFVEIAKHIEGLDFTTAPDYSKMHELLRRKKTTVPFEWMNIKGKNDKPSQLPNDPTGFLVSLAPHLDKVMNSSCLLI